MVTEEANNETNKIILFFFTIILMGLFFYSPRTMFPRESGFKYIRNYSPKEYDHKPQNWAIVQDENGIIYVANQGGLLQYDGVSWRLLLIPNWNVLSLAVDKKTGTVCIGGNNEIGFLDADLNGSLKYVSLLGQLREHQKNFGKVWATCSTRKGVYFQAPNYLFRWEPGQLKIWEEPEGIKAAFSCGGELFIRRAGVGIMKMENDQLTPIPGGDAFAEKGIYMMVQYQQDTQELLIGTPENGLYIYDGAKAEPFPTEADDFLKKKVLYTGIRLSSGDFAMATSLGGIVIIDSRGRLKHIFNKASGLGDDNVRYIFETPRGNLWLGLDKGISKIEYTSPITILDERSNLPGLVLSMVKHEPDGVLYAGTTSGLYYFSPTAGPGNFHPVPGIKSPCWSLLSIDDSLLAATERGVFQVEDKHNARWKSVENSSLALLRSRFSPNRVWVGTDKGVFSLHPENETGKRRWTIEHQLEKITDKIASIAEDEKGNLWLGTLTRGVLNAVFPTGTVNAAPRVNRYEPPDTSHGLPPGPVNVFTAAGHIMFTTEKGIFRFHPEKDIFIADTTLGNEFAGPDGTGVYYIVEDRKKDIWLHSRQRNIHAIRQPDGTFLLKKQPFLRIPRAQVDVIYPEPGGNITWFGGEEGIIRYDIRVKKNYAVDFKTLIRKFEVNGNPVFNGNKSGRRNASHPEPPVPVIDYKDRNVRFEFAAPFFEDESAMQYRCLLEGYDDQWSGWSAETRKDYTNLYSGMYTFRVRARNVYQNESNESVYRFKVLPPWYKTWWALSIDVFFLFLLMFLIIKWRSGKLEREKQKLEQTVEDRTKEIIQKNKQLEDQTGQLKEQSVKLKEMAKVKSRFFANISHEFRTPLTLIMGPLEQRLDKETDRNDQKELNLMLRNARRLLGLINQLLELSKFESGKIKLQASRQNIVPFLRGIIHSFDPVAVKNELALALHAPEAEEYISLYYDPGKLEEVLLNILSNAVKFTPPGGKITVSVTQNHKDEEDFPAGSVDISIHDTGPGIPRGQLEHIFDRFYQSDATYEHHRKGSGIGLSIAQELVGLHGGKINVHSREGKGTEFIIRLPLGKEHLKPDEIVEIPTPPIPRNTSPVLTGIPETDGTETIDSDETGETEKDIDAMVTGKDIVLVVEDSADIREYIRGSLEPAYTVVEAGDGREGIQKAQEIIPDLIISDIMMPGVDGHELCRQLKNDVKTSHIPIVLLTARASEENIIEGLETGADDYVTKPFSTAILSARIKNLIDLRRHMQLTVNREMSLKPVKIPVSQIDKTFIKKLRQAIRENISDPDFNIEQLCKKLDMSQPTLYRKIHALTGESPTEFIRSYRLKQGAELLKNNFGTVLEVAFEVGFSSAAYFTKCFKKKFHQSPTLYRETEAGEANSKAPLP